MSTIVWCSNLHTARDSLQTQEPVNLFSGTHYFHDWYCWTLQAIWALKSLLCLQVWNNDFWNGSRILKVASRTLLEATNKTTKINEVWPWLIAQTMVQGGAHQWHHPARLPCLRSVLDLTYSYALYECGSDSSWAGNESTYESHHLPPQISEQFPTTSWISWTETYHIDASEFFRILSSLEIFILFHLGIWLQVTLSLCPWEGKFQHCWTVATCSADSACPSELDLKSYTATFLLALQTFWRSGKWAALKSLKEPISRLQWRPKKNCLFPASKDLLPSGSNTSLHLKSLSICVAASGRKQVGGYCKPSSSQSLHAWRTRHCSPASYS